MGRPNLVLMIKLDIKSGYLPTQCAWLVLLGYAISWAVPIDF
jgi:hypothetical protein